MKTNEREDLIPISMAATLFNVKYMTLFNRISSGSLKGYQVKGRTYVSPQDIVEWEATRHDRKRGSSWKKVEEALAQGKSDIAIAEQLGISRERVRQIRTDMGVAKNPRRPGLPNMRLALYRP